MTARAAARSWALHEAAAARGDLADAPRRLVERAAADRAAGACPHRAASGAAGLSILAVDSRRSLAEPSRIPRPLPRWPRLAPTALHPAGVVGRRLDGGDPDGGQRA